MWNTKWFKACCVKYLGDLLDRSSAFKKAEDTLIFGGNRRYHDNWYKFSHSDLSRVDRGSKVKLRK